VNQPQPEATTGDEKGLEREYSGFAAGGAKVLTILALHARP
jgi:hypothetical protein